MSYVGNTNTTQAFTPAIDYFSGNGSTVAFTLSRPVASVAQVQVVVNNVAQNPTDAFTVLNNTITFTSAPSSGTNNIYVQYTSPITQVIQPGQGTVGAVQLVTGAVGTTAIADGSITTAKIAAGAVATVDIADSAVTTAKIADLNVTTAKIADLNVTTAKIADANVTTAKIADANVTGAKLENSGVAAGTYGSSSAVSVVTVDAKGRVTSATTAAIASSAPTTAQVLTATAGASAYAVGAYGSRFSTTSYTVSSTYAGSSIGLSTGTWRCMANVQPNFAIASGPNACCTTLRVWYLAHFLRIS